MKIYQVVQKIEYEADWVLGTFLKEESAMNLINKHERCKNCPLNYLCGDEAEFPDSLKQVKECCPHYKPHDIYAACCENMMQPYDNLIIKTIEVIED